MTMKQDQNQPTLPKARPVRRVLSRIAGVLLVLVLAAILALQSADVQAFLARRVIERYIGDIDGEIQFESAQLRPFHGISLKGLVITDRNPFQSEYDIVPPPPDTLLRVGTLSATFSLASIFPGSSIPIRNLSLNDVEFNLVLEPGNTENISRVFRISDETDTTALSLPGIVIRKVDISNVRFRMLDIEEMEKQLHRDSLWRPADETDWTNIDIRAREIQVRDLHIAENLESLETDILKLGAREWRSGFTLDPITGHLRVDGSGAVITDGRIGDQWTDLHVKQLAMYYSAISDFKKALDKVSFDIVLERSHFDLRSVSMLSEELKELQFDADFEGHAQGPIRDMHFSDFRLYGGSSGISAQKIAGRIRHTPKVREMTFDFSVDGFRGTAAGLDRFVRGWKPGIDLSELTKWLGSRTLTASATSTGTLDELMIKGTLQDGKGTAAIDGVLRNLYDPKPIVVEGDLQTRNMHVGSLLGMEEIGELTMNGNARATLLPDGLEATISRLHIDRLHALGYDYSDIDATGLLRSNYFKGNIVSRDPNLDCIFSGSILLPTETENGRYAFQAQVGYADLAALHFDSRETSQLDLRMKADYEQTPDGGFKGEVAVRDIHLKSDAGDHEVGDVLVYSSSSEQENSIDLLSAFATAHFTGTRPITDFIDDLLAETLRRDLPTLLGSVDVKETPSQPSDGEYSFRLRIGDTRELLGFLAPGTYIAQGTTLALRQDPEYGLRAALRSEGAIYEGIYAKDISMRMGASEDRHIRAEVKAREVGLGEKVTMTESQLTAYAESDAVEWRYRFDFSETGQKGDVGDIRLRTFFSRDADREDALVVTADVPASTLSYMGTPWDLSAREIRYMTDDLEIGQLALSSDEQYLRVDGRIAPYDDALMNLTLQDFKLNLVNYLLPDYALDLQGRLSGRVELLSPFETMPIMDARLLSEETRIGGYDLGQLRFMSQWLDDEDLFSLRLRDDARTFDLYGYLAPEGMKLDTQLRLNGLQIGCAAPLLTDVFSDFEGLAYGTVSVSGPLDRLKVGSKDLRIKDGLLQIDYTDVPYFVEGPLDLTEEHLLFDQLSIRDRYTGQAGIRGGLYFDHNFSDLRYDLAIDMKEMECLDLSKKQNDVFYGNVFGSGNVNVSGDLDAFRLRVNAETVKRGSLHIPFDYATDAASGDLLRFREPAPLRVNPIDSILYRNRDIASSPMDIDIDIHVDATPEVQMLIEVDPSTGNVLTANGEGSLDLGYHKDEFTIGGDYTLSGGNYHFSALVATRDFAIQRGSTIHFNGDIYDSDLDMKATYSTKASLASLIADSTMTRRRVDCIVAVTDKLRNPSVEISIEIPDLDPTTQGLVSGALNTQDNIQRQFLSLLVSGNFMPTEQSGIVNNNSDLLFSNVSAIMSDQLNQILETLNIPFDLGLNYQSTSAGNDLFDVAISTQLFNNRVIVNGNIGNRQYGTAGATGTTGEVAGDLDIAIKLNKTGSIRATLFSHSADQYTNYLDNSQRNGAGFSFQKEFSTFGNLLRSIFLGPSWHSDTEKEKDTAQHTLVITADPQNE